MQWNQLGREGPGIAACAARRTKASNLRSSAWPWLATCTRTPPPPRSSSLARPLAQAMIDEFDTDGDGEISLHDFGAVMKSTALYDNE